MMNTINSFAPLLGRILIAALFIPAGISKITGFAGTSGYMASKGLPMADVLLVLTIIIELGGGIMLLAGVRAKEVALIIFLFLIPVTVVFHGYWGIEDAAAQSKEQIAFMKNIAIMGGLLFIAAFGAGKFAVDKE
ncbi:MAG: DoxX family protein [Porticoccaceae bacterium]|nr:DoxX family protein [Porticoccaceae bacterium]